MASLRGRASLSVATWAAVAVISAPQARPAVATDQPSASSQPAVPVEPIPAVIEAFRSHRVVTMESHHGNEQLNAFAIAVIRDPRFSVTVSDIVVEFGTARHHALIDRFVEGEDVAPPV